MRAELANLYHRAVPFLSRAGVNLSWYDSTNNNMCVLCNIDCILYNIIMLCIIYITQYAHYVMPCVSYNL